MTSALLEQLQETLGSGYKLERELAGGGMSRVFVAHERALGRRIVVKILPPELAAGVSVERFNREIQLAATLLHPHIIPLLSAGDADGLPYYTMPLVEGESLRLRVAREGPLDVAIALRLTREIAMALDYAHRQGVIHRDIKPENVLLHDGHALVTDFGIARAINRAASGASLTVVGVALGTPFYMSPEQGSGDRELDGRSDIYSLGCVLYEMLTGEPPFRGNSPQLVVMRHFTEPVPRPSAVRPEVTADVDEIVRRAMAKDPAERFATGAELARAVDWCAVIGAGMPSLTRGSTPGAGATVVTPISEEPTSRFLAVLPFDNMSSDPQNEYFSDGMTEEIIAQLSKIRGLKVISRTSVMKYKRAQVTARQIGRELGVSHLLGGSVRRAGQRVRISAHLIDAAADQHLWAETYDRDMTDIFAIQSEVAQEIATRMQARVTPGEHFRLVRKPTEDIDAYHHFLLGRHHYNKVTPGDFAKAMEHYRAAIARDPTFARAYACMAEAQLYLGFGYWGVRPHDTFPEGYRLATKALELDITSAEAHGAAGMYQEFYEFDWDRGGASVQRAVELNPSAPMLRILLAMHLVGVGRFDDAMSQRDIARQLDPAAMAIHGNASWIAYLVGRREQAVAEGRTLRLLEPESAYGAFSHGLVCAGSVFGDEAVSAFRDAVRLSDRMSLYVVMLAYALARVGASDEARSLLAEVHARTNEFVWPMGLAFAYAHLGETETALDYLDRAYDERVGWMVLMAREPALEILREHPRFRRLARRIGPAPALAKSGLA